MPLNLCNVTGTVKDSEGAALASLAISFVRTGTVASQGTSPDKIAEVPKVFTVTTDGSGGVDFDAHPGSYTGTVVRPNSRDLTFEMAVPDAASADIADIIDSVSSLSNTILQEATAARDKAQQWAEEPEDSEVETGQYSALHHAEKAGAAQVSAEAARDLAQGYAADAANSENSAATSADTALAAAEATGLVTFYDTKAEATAAVGGLSEGDIVEVLADESRSGGRARYRVESGALVFKVDLTGQIVLVDDLAALKALSTAQEVAFLQQADRQGLYRWDGGIAVATHQADDEQFTYVAPDAGTDGAWVRQDAVSVPARVEPDNVRDLRGLAKGANGIELVSELTDPTLAANSGRRVILAGQPPVFAFCDGASWWDMTNGTEISPWWLPRGAVLHVDFDNSRFYWGGAERVLGDLTSVPAGGYSLATGFGFTDTAWVQIEYSPDTDLADFSGHMFSWTSGYPAGNRIEFSRSNNATYGDGVRLYVAPGNPTADFLALGPTSKDGEGGAVYLRDERRKLLVRIKNNTNHKHQPDNGDLRDGTKGSGALTTPTLIGFGCRAWASGDPDSQLTDATLHRVTIWADELAAPHIASVGKAGDTPPVHLLGDSFLNLYGIGTQFMKLCTTANKIVPFSQDGIGGTTLTQQAARYAAYAGSQREKWWHSTLVICDFGFEGTAAEGIEAIKEMLRYIRHDRWLYMQPAPSSALNPVTPLPEKHAIMKAWCGDHFVSTLPEAWAESDGSTADEDQIAVGRWPVSLTISETDFHPNDAGRQFIAQCIYDALVARGWI